MCIHIFLYPKKEDPKYGTQNEPLSETPRGNDPLTMLLLEQAQVEMPKMGPPRLAIERQYLGRKEIDFWIFFVGLIFGLFSAS
jgi:hypothetical protein